MTISSNTQVKDPKRITETLTSLEKIRELYIKYNKYLRKEYSNLYIKRFIRIKYTDRNYLDKNSYNY